MSELRRSRAAQFRGTLALIELVEPDRPNDSRPFSGEVRAGAEQRSRELGFSIDRFLVGPGCLSPHRLGVVLASRGITGVMVLPAFREAHLEGIDWSRLAAVYLDRVIRFPPLHSVSTDHHSAIWQAFSHLESRGYKRIGLVLQTQQDERLQNRWEGACHAFAHTHTRLNLVPMLVAAQITESMFRVWFRRHRPDVILGHSGQYIDWMRGIGARLPTPHGFLALNAAMCDRRCAAIDQQPRLIGVRGAELVIGQLLRGEAGLPENPCHTSVPARIVEGPTLK